MSFTEDDARLAAMHGYQPAWIELLLTHLQKLTDAVERVDARLETLERNLKARGSL